MTLSLPTHPQQPVTRATELLVSALTCGSKAAQRLRDYRAGDELPIDTGGLQLLEDSGTAFFTFATIQLAEALAKADPKAAEEVARTVLETRDSRPEDVHDFLKFQAERLPGDHEDEPWDEAAA